MTKELNIDNKLIKKVLIITGISGLTLGLLIVALVQVNNFYKDNYLEFRSPLQSPIVVKAREMPQNDEIEEEVDDSQQEEQEAETAEIKVGRITAYSCGGITTEAERKMNCPNGITATGTTPKPYHTMACDRANLGKQFEINGHIWTCEDTGGAIEGEGRFDIYLETVDEARQFGVQYLAYKLVN